LRKSSRMLNTGSEDLPTKIMMMIDSESDLSEKMVALQQKTSQLNLWVSYPRWSK